MNREPRWSTCRHCGEPIYTGEWPLDDLARWRHEENGRPECTARTVAQPVP